MVGLQIMELTSSKTSEFISDIGDMSRYFVEPRLGGETGEGQWVSLKPLNHKSTRQLSKSGNSGGPCVALVGI
jgi:hypothetical protein